MSLKNWVSSRVVHPIDLPEIIRAVATVLFAVAATVAVLVTNGAKNDEKHRADSLSAQVSANQDVQNCRSLLSTAVTDATTTYQFAIGQDQLAQDQLVVALASGTRDLRPQLEALRSAGVQITRAGISLDAARKTRVSYEQGKFDRCPKITIPSTTGSSPNAGTSETTTTTTTTTTTIVAPPTTRRRSTTTTSPATSSSTPPRGSTTTTTTTTMASEPPTCDLIPGNGMITIPPGVPCL